jgi:hypothetical protein
MSKFSERHPEITTGLQVVALIVGMGAFLALISGIFAVCGMVFDRVLPRIGGFVCAKFGWQSHGDTFVQFIGFTTLFVPVALYHMGRLANFFGKSVMKEWEYRRGQ